MTKGVVCQSVENLTPVEEGNVFSSNAGLLYFFTDVTLAPGVESVIYHVWYYGDKEMARITLSVNGPRWRTYSSKTIFPTWTEEWHVDVVTTDDQVIKSVSFRIK